VEQSARLQTATNHLISSSQETRNSQEPREVPRTLAAPAHDTVRSDRGGSSSEYFSSVKCLTK
jgi:hypothetical protein